MDKYRFCFDDGRGKPYFRECTFERARDIAREAIITRSAETIRQSVMRKDGTYLYLCTYYRLEKSEELKYAAEHPEVIAVGIYEN